MSLQQSDPIPRRSASSPPAGRVRALDRPDVLLAGDLVPRRAVRRAYGFDHLPTEEEMVQVADRWRPNRSPAVSNLFAFEFGKGT